MHQADLVRRDRLQALLEQRQKQLQMRALEIDRRFEQMQRDSRDLEDQAKQLDEWHTRLAADTERLMQQKKDQDLSVSQIEQRAGVLEGQQAMLASLRTRLERMREELRPRGAGAGRQRAAQELTEIQLRQRIEESERLRKELEADRLLIAEDLRQREQRQAALDAAVAQIEGKRASRCRPRKSNCVNCESKWRQRRPSRRNRPACSWRTARSWRKCSGVSMQIG